ERTIRPPQVGRAHAGESFSIGSHGREIRRNAEHRIGDAVVVENFPERFPAAQLFRTAATQGNHPTAQMYRMFRRLHSRSREVKRQSFRITMDKVEQAVSAGIHARNHVRTSNRALRWNTRDKE